MIKVEMINVSGFEAAIRGMRNPLNSHAKSDSYWTHIENPETMNEAPFQYFVGENDLDLMRRLFWGGSEHRKYMRQIFVSMDITAPLYWWSEYDTYKIGTTANSCSKMHKLLHKEFEMSDFSFDKLPGYRNEIKQFRPEIDEEEELWRKIDCDYEVSNQGRIRHGVRILSGSVHKDGYIFATLHGKQTPLHRFVASAFIPNPERKPEVNHKDGNKMNNCASNLEWVTRSENQQHAVDNGFQPRGLANYCGKFSEEQREEIKRLWDNGEMKRRQLAEKYGVSHTCINDIINDKYKYIRKVNVYETVARTIVDTANELRDAWFATENIDEKLEIWYSIIQLLPEGYNQKRTVTMNYENVVNMIRQRTNHKLTEWREFVEILRGLPYIEDIITPKTDGIENV